MADLLAPLWEYLFDTFGVFGVVIACGLVMVVIALAIYLIILVFGAIVHATEKKAVRPHQKAAEDVAWKVKADDEEDLSKLLAAAKAGDVTAQCEVGRIYYYGYDTHPDEGEGIFWLNKAAAGGSVYARLTLGRIGDEKMRFQDPGQLIDWLEEVADCDAEIQYRLANAYSRKKEWYERQKGYEAGQWKDDPLCVEWYRKSKYWLKEAAKNGCEEAQELLW